MLRIVTNSVIVETYCQPGGIDLIKAILSPQNNQQTHIGVYVESTGICLYPMKMFAVGKGHADVLSVAIVHSADHFVREAEYTPASYRKAAYCQ